MPNATVRANAQAMPMNRRSAFGAIAAAGALLAIPKIAPAANLDALDALIAAHQQAREALLRANDELDAAEPDGDAILTAMGGLTWTLRNGRERLVLWIEDHFRQLTRGAEIVADVSPKVGAEALAILESERDASLARLDAAYATKDAAEVRWQDKYDADDEALMAISAHRCGSPEEVARKFRYLRALGSELFEDEYLDTIFASLLPEGEG